MKVITEITNFTKEKLISIVLLNLLYFMSFSESQPEKITWLNFLLTHPPDILAWPPTYAHRGYGKIITQVTKFRDN